MAKITKMTTLPSQPSQTIATAAAILARGDVRLSTEQVERLARTIAPLARAGMLSPDEQIDLAALLAHHNRMA